MNNSKTILGLDPSSTACGYAVNSGGVVIDGGVIWPQRKSAASWERICSMRRDLRSLFEQYRPRTVLIEWTKGKVNINRHHGHGAGLAVYGCGVGAIAVECDIYCRDNNAHLYVINENDWTRGVSKKERQLAIDSKYEQYEIRSDPGGDASDAIGIIDWWLKENLFCNSFKGTEAQSI
jgi:hypothetical protein